jgi:hypothetical protein
MQNEVSDTNGQLDVMRATRVVRSGLSYDIQCAACGRVVRRDVRTERAPLYNRKRIEDHLMVCTGQFPKWWERLFRFGKDKPLD